MVHLMHKFKRDNRIVRSAFMFKMAEMSITWLEINSQSIRIVIQLLHLRNKLLSHLQKYLVTLGLIQETPACSREPMNLFRMDLLWREIMCKRKIYIQVSMSYSPKPMIILNLSFQITVEKTLNFLKMIHMELSSPNTLNTQRKKSGGLQKGLSISQILNYSRFRFKLIRSI